ncbi:acyl-ACP thioesterase [Periweissella cryptocerci]|uniref:Acyl-ACP thioesterase n=1 Tax=Periweissella cryptocerci TaxID=2506420 RepID=A0A4P6YUY0_9LACO|nr:acyl-ACP thioesterase domain-containing protein [Periweissella cryptocerci]QBO36572.1 acyl-ACP thioesterase [Periweissella cryptocerci]
MAGAVFAEEHRVLYYEADITGKLTTANILNLAILASGDQSETLGVGNAEIHAQNIGWVILQYNIDITRRPSVGEQIVIKTQADHYNPYFAVRNFWLETSQGEKLVDIRAIFTMIDMEARKMVRIPQVMMEAYQADKVKKIERIPNPMQLAETELPEVMHNFYHVRFFDIDHNHHVNNAHYFTWMQDPLGAEFLTQNEVVNINIKYESEIRYGSEINSYYKILPAVDGIVTTLHQIRVDNELMTEAEMKWRAVTD